MKTHQMKTWVKVLIGVAVAAILAVTAGPFVYINFIKDDAPDKLSLDDVPTSTDAVGASEQVSTTTIAPTTTSTATSAPAASGVVDGSYTVTTGSQAGYRVVEVLFGQDTEGVGRTTSVGVPVIVR